MPLFGAIGLVALCTSVGAQDDWKLGYDGGFFVRSADGRHELVLEGLFQAELRASPFHDGRNTSFEVRRMRPEALQDYDYDRETYTRELWLAEGLTSYYDNLLLFRSGLIDVADFFELLAEEIRIYETTPGRLVRSAELSKIAVVTTPGSTITTRRPKGATSPASASLAPSRACFEAV